MHFQWQDLNTTVTRPVEILWRFIAQRTLLGGRYTGKVEQESCAIAKMIAQCAPYGCPEIFWTNDYAHGYFSRNFSWTFVLIDPINVRTKFKVRTCAVPEIIGGTQKWAVPGYAHALSSPKFLMGFSSDASYKCTCQIGSP